MTVAVQGEGAGRLPANEHNVVARGVQLAYEAAGRPFKGCALTCVNRIPAARGLGSSAAAWVGGLVAGNALLGDAALARGAAGPGGAGRGAPDNVAAALLRRAHRVVRTRRRPSDRRSRCRCPRPSRWVVLVPSVTSATAEARAVLPDSVPRRTPCSTCSASRCCWRACRPGGSTCSRARSTTACTSPIACDCFPGCRPWPTPRAVPVRSGCVLSRRGAVAARRRDR